MIEINLLPKELRKKKSKFKIPDITLVFLPVTAALIGFLIFIQLALGLLINAKNRTYTRLNKEYSELLPQKLEVDTIKKDIQEIQMKVDTINQLMIKRILWSRKMNQLNDSMISGVWLTKLSLGKKKAASRPAAPQVKKAARGAPVEIKAQPVLQSLNIEGRASSSYGDETAVVGRFIKSLKENKEFFNEFSQIELELIERKTIKDIEVMNFRISCYFK